MKGRFWRKALAASLALLIVTGSVPIKPISNMFESMVVTAEAVEEYTKTFDFSTGQKSDDNSTLSLIDATDNERKSVVIVTDIQNGWISRWSNNTYFAPGFTSPGFIISNHILYYAAQFLIAVSLFYLPL